MGEVLFLPAAADDFREALDWYEERSAKAAAGFEAAVEVVIRAVSETPQRWTTCDSRHRFYALRRYLFSMIYRLVAEDILVVAIAHAGRAQTYWRTRD